MAPAPPATPGRFASAIQVLVCCGQLPTQTPIFGLLMLLGMKAPVGDVIPLPFFAAMTLLDTVVVGFMIVVFLRSSGESVRQVLFGVGILKKELGVGLMLVPVVLIGTGMLMGIVRVAFPGLHNVKVSPFDSFFDTNAHAALFVFVVIVAGGIREELARGFLLHRFDQNLGGIWVGQAIYTVVFGAAHYTQGWDAVVTVGALGFFWGWLYIKRRNVAAAMVSHASFDALQVLGQLLVKTLGIPVR